MAKNVKRLFDQFIPSNYELAIALDMAAMSFNGSVTITGKKVGRPSQRLTFHQKSLKILEVKLIKHLRTGDQEVKVERINLHNSLDELRLHAGEMIYPGEYTASINFSGSITRQMNGLYPCFFDHNSKPKSLLATQFESHHAREVFPCIDEPEAKATFDLTLTAQSGETVIANTPIKNQKIDKDRVITKFETTPVMSTYLLAFVVGELGYKEAKTKHGTLVRTYATPDNVKFTEFSLDVAVKVLEFYNDYFGIAYPLSKCDMVALPDFASGAMENWGCVTYREQAMLVDPDNSTLAARQYVAMVVAHELAHQWFGNLVTMRWWTDLWLNEGFASWIEYMAVDHLYPEWEMWTQFIVDEQQQALKLDALEHTHPIEVPVRHPDEIRTIFDTISYSKGASVIHMLHEYLGPQLFRDGLRHYLKNHSYASTDTVDLWQSLEEISKKPVKEFMQAWTSQPGFPIVSVSAEGNNLELSQERFFLNPNHTKLQSTKWPVPLLSPPHLTQTLEATTLTIPLAKAETFKLNLGQSGFYRITYKSDHLNKLGALIQDGKLAPLDRLGVLSDLLESAKAGKSATIDVLHFLKNFKNEDNYAVWDVIASALGSIRLVMDDEGLRADMKPYIRDLVAVQLKRLGWNRAPGESHFDSLLRPIIIGLAAGADEPTVVKKSLKLFADIKDKINIDPDLRGAVFGTVARLGGETDFNKLLALHNASLLSEERNTIASAITGFKQPKLIKKALDLIKTETVRLQDVSYWVAYSLMNRHAKTQGWEWMKANWTWLDKQLGSDLSFSRMPIYAARVFSQESFIQEFEAFFEPLLSPALERAYRQGIEILQWQAAWKKRDFKTVSLFFKNYQ